MKEGIDIQHLLSTKHNFILFFFIRYRSYCNVVPVSSSSIMGILPISELHLFMYKRCVICTQFPPECMWQTTIGTNGAIYKDNIDWGVWLFKWIRNSNITTTPIIMSCSNRTKSKFNLHVLFVFKFSFFFVFDKKIP